ncbi:hypothetical protein O0L34_g12594 [Tuta absoluta]|nr:hypothetical protein O0L34_g12594 [Tuta absoluta]
MASQDVIELGSSDEETEPAPKKANPVKRPNAMVQIPSGVTIKPAKKSVNRNFNPIKELIGKGVTVTKVNKSNPSPPTSSLRNGKPTTKPARIPTISNIPPQGLVNMPGIQVKSMALVNPLNVMKKFNNSITIRPPNVAPIKFPVKNAQSFNNLPSGLTVIKKGGLSGVQVAGPRPGIKFPITITGSKRGGSTIKTNVKKRRKISPEIQVPTVNLDDEEVPTTSTASPQWYLRPEDPLLPDAPEKHKSEDPLSMEAQNNAEPAGPKFLEITIEDSPIKPAPNKRTHEIGAELAITIDDSPVKAVATMATSADSDSEKAGQTPKEKQSKKKLDYPKEVQIEKEQEKIIETNTIEIEFEPIDTPADTENDENMNNDENNKKSDEDVIINEEVIIDKESISTKQNEKVIMSDIIEVFESPAKGAEIPLSTPKKITSETRKVKPIAMTSKSSQPSEIHPAFKEQQEPSEFHPVYQEFIDLCFKLENSNDMKTIVEKKIKGYYRQVPKEYTESEEFVELVQSKLLSMRAGPEKLYLYIKDIVDELNLQRKMAKAKPTVKETINLEAEKFQYGEESEFDSKRQRQIRKLEKTLKKLHRAIQKLEEQEVDFDDEEDSVYLLTERYKERMVRVHAKFCQLTNTKMPSEPRIQIQPRPGQPAGPAKRLEKWVNKKVPIGKPLPFPDFHDVLRCVREANDEDKLRWNEADIMEEARDLFTRCGKKLQRRRQENEWRLAASRISLDVDPAENSNELKKKLDTNKQMAARKETEVFNKYADKQSQLNLEAVEIGDKEADESPVESEDEEPQEESSTLENKEKRKERLRRLISEKSKKTESKENSPMLNSPSEEIVAIEDNAQRDTEKVENEAMDVDLVPEEGKQDDKKEGSVAQSADKEKESSDKEKVHSISGDSKVDSDVDELHLLQKLHSDEVNTSAIDSTDSESPIDISDTLSSNDNKKQSNSDNVISIENSSYSETETKDSMGKEAESDNDAVKEVAKLDEMATIPEEKECSEDQASTTQINKTNNQEYNESVESILLGTSDDEADDKEKDESPRSIDECVNLKDDAISIGETVIENGDKNKGASVAQSNENIRSSDENSVKASLLKNNFKNGEESEDKLAKNVDSTNKQENDSKAGSTEVIEEIHSIETVESDNSQTAVEKHKESNLSKCDEVVESNIEAGKLTIESIESDSSQDNSNGNDIVLSVERPSVALDNPSVETLGSENSQDAVKETEDVEMPDAQHIDKSPSVETLESENSQDVVRETEDVDMPDAQDADKNPSVETLGSENSQEPSNETRDIEMADKQNPDKIENQSVGTVETENSQEPTKGDDVITAEDKLSDEMQVIETLDSENSQETAKISDVNESDKQCEQPKDRISGNNSPEVHELTDSNSPNQIENEIEEKSSNDKISEDMNSLESIIEDLRSDIGLNDLVATTE